MKRKTYTHCKRCGKRRVPPDKFTYASRAHWERDPYCTRKCAEGKDG